MSSFVIAVCCVIHLTTQVLAYGEIPMENMSHLLQEHRIIPECIPYAPSQFLKIKYIHTPVELGMQFDTETIMYQPTYLKWEADEDAFYTLILTGIGEWNITSEVNYLYHIAEDFNCIYFEKIVKRDSERSDSSKRLDVPTQSNSSQSEYNHWIKVNIPGNAWFAGDTLAEYVGSGLQYSSGPHRLVYLVYKQPEAHKILFDEEILKRESRPLLRCYFGAQRFSAKYSMGPPIAANFITIDERH